ncbi:hypothetical protein TYRP_019110 [Tyrophagus putrescentiae]|nr:hypothetical protein TYRP_019110 [Tyrophagus putrescentiae]
MSKIFFNSFAVLALICTLQFVTVESCSCPPVGAIKRNVGCKDEFMAIVNITGVTVHEDHIELGRDYSFVLIEDYSPHLASHLSLSNIESINTGIYEAVCGITLSLHTTYLMKGDFVNGKPRIALCRAYTAALTHVPTKTGRKTMFEDFLVILGLKGKTSAADQVNFSLSGPTSPEAQICYGRLASSNATQEKCLSAAETQWNVTVSVIGNGTEPSEAQCNAWTSSLQCIDEAICKLCSKPEIADIGQWELAAYENRSFCGLDSTKAPIDWCKNRTVGQDNSSFSSSSSAASSKVKSSSPIVITIVAVLMLTMIILAGIAIILMINAPDKEDSKGDDGHQSTAKNLPVRL